MVDFCSGPWIFPPFLLYADVRAVGEVETLLDLVSLGFATIKGAQVRVVRTNSKENNG